MKKKSCTTCAPGPETLSKLEWAKKICQQRGLRKTVGLEKVLAFLTRHEHPVLLANVAAHPPIAKSCDPATVFRILRRLEEIGVAKRLWLHERAPYYVLLAPHQHQDYVMCTGCGKVEETGLACPVRELEKEVSQRLGYRELRHELGFYGVCPECQGH